MSKTHSRIWLITGCSTGFGRKLSEAVLDKGDRLIATARNVAQLKDLETSHPTQVLVTQLDVTNPESIQSSVAAGKEKFGRIDVLVNNAGYGLAAVLEDATDTQIRHLFETNFFGLLNVTRAVLPVMREQQSGHILNTCHPFTPHELVHPGTHVKEILAHGFLLLTKSEYMSNFGKRPCIKSPEGAKADVVLFHGMALLIELHSVPHGAIVETTLVTSHC
jgi:hypothetical protein